MTEIRIYFEGHPRLKRGFSEFLREILGAARKKRCRFELIAAGAASKAVEDYRTALVKHPGAWNVLLKDSEGPDHGRLFDELRQREGLDSHLVGSVFWMVQVMESWFLPDADVLADYYGKGFRKGTLAGNPKVEEVPKQDVERKLRAATKHTSKGPYHKTKHAPDLLARIHPERVCATCPNCRRMFDVLTRRLSSR